MKSLFHFTWILLIILISTFPGALQASDFETENNINFIWSDVDHKVLAWDVLAKPETSTAEEERFSLLSPNLQTSHLQLDGIISGQPLSQSFLKIDYFFREESLPYRQNLTIRMTNNSNEIFAPTNNDSAYLVLGPGLGNQQVEGLGYAKGLYSYIEAVAFDGNNTHLFRANSSHPTELDWQQQGIAWFGLHGRYFALLLSPLDEVPNNLNPIVYLADNPSTSIDPEQLLILEWELALQILEPNESIEWTYEIYSGPKSKSFLNAGQIDYEEILLPGQWRWLRWLSLRLMELLSLIHILVPSWGAAIIVLAVIVRLLMYPIASKAIKQQKAFVSVQKKIGPEIVSIKTRYSGEEQSERILALYEQYGVSPLAGLKPLLIVLIQLPVLMALFHGLGTVYELRDASFLWIETLAEPDKLFPLNFSIPILGEFFNLLPFLMTLSTLAAMKLSPAPVSDDSAKKKQNFFLILMSLAFFILFYPFPSGMVLYWTMANLLHIGQHRFISR